MRAAVIRRHGPPEVFEWREMPEPVPGEGDVCIRVHAIGINFADLLARMGLYPGAPKPPFIPGLELSGMVEVAPPARAGALRVNDHVLALTNFNAYAERVVVPARQVFRIPEGMSFEHAAAIPVNYLTAYHAMFQMGNLQPGDRILIHGAAGGVGIAAVQLARTRKLIIFGTAGPGKQQFLKKIGVHHPLDYTREDFVHEVRRIAPDGIEMVMDPIGGESYARSARCLGPTGRLVVYGFSSAAGPEAKRNLWRGLRALWRTPRFHPLSLMSKNLSVIGVHLGRLETRGALLRRELEHIFRLYAAGRLQPVIAKTFPLQEAPAAHHFIHARLNIGKVLLLAR